MQTYSKFIINSYFWYPIFIIKKMKKHLIIFLICLPVFSFNIAAQDSYIGFNLGTSIPGGDFASAEDMLADGYAIPGFTIRFEGFYYPFSIVGIGGMVDFGSLYANRDVYLEQLLDYTYNSSDLPLLNNPPGIAEVDFESGFWNYVNLFAGPEISIPFWRFQAGVRALGGLSMVTYPKRELYYPEGPDELEALVKGTRLSLGYTYGGSLLYRSRAGTGIKLSADYLNSSAGYDFELKLITDAETFSDTETGDIDIEALSVTLGFFYVF